MYISLIIWRNFQTILYQVRSKTLHPCLDDLTSVKGIEWFLRREKGPSSFGLVPFPTTSFRDVDDEPGWFWSAPRRRIQAGRFWSASLRALTMSVKGSGCRR